MKKVFQFKLIFLFSACCILCFSLSGCQRQYLYKDSRMMMGTIVQIISPDKQAAYIAFKEISRIESLLSLFKEDSEISRLNKLRKLKVSPETLLVIKKAGEFWKVTQGALDITTGPLIALWGFYDQTYHLPSDYEVEEKLGLIGFDKIKIDGNIIEFNTKGMKIDLGAIAKGFAVDCAVKKLRLAGIDSALLNAGGDVYCLGDKNRLLWTVAIRSADNLISARNLKLKDKAVATSGDYEQYFSVGNARYCHILNPKTGRPADSGVVSVTVIADECLTADALATSIFIVGKNKGQELAKAFNAEVIIHEAIQDNK